MLNKKPVIYFKFSLALAGTFGPALNINAAMVTALLRW